MSDAIAGVGAAFKRGDGASPEVFTAIAEINSITGPSMTRETIDVTSLDSTGGYREYITGFRDGGEVTLVMNFTRDGWEAMRIDFTTDDTVNYQIVMPDTGATELNFAAYVTDLPILLVGGVRSVEVMNRILDEGSADLISLSRPLIREPDLPKRCQDGRDKATCISCNQCWPREGELGISCHYVQDRASEDEPETER